MGKENKGANRDYTGKTFTVVLTVIILLTGVAFIPGFKLGGMTFKRANILSDILKFNDRTGLQAEYILDTSFYEDVPEGLLAMLDRRVSGSGANEISNDSADIPVERVRYALPAMTDTSITAIEDYSEGGQMMAKFYHDLAMESAKRPIRIAVFGDSFIEADIITVDMREQLQDRFGGNGVGFVPFSTPLAKYRSSVKHTFNGWETYNIINKKGVPEEYKNRFFISGMISIPSEGATVRYEGSTFRDHLKSTSNATLLFKNRAATNISISLNGGESQTFTPESGDRLQHITLDGDISRLDMKVTGVKGFIGYGAVLEDAVGVSVHNYSVRSNSGTALIGTDADLNRSINELMKFDLIILQYGLNAMSADVLNYDYYGKQLVRIIEFVKMCFPQSAVMVMSVGDRSTLKDGSRVTMPAAMAMLKTQRKAAEETGVAFWNTFQAMGGENSMVKFVERGWAAKDYTHIGFPGGKYIGTQFANSLTAAAESVGKIYKSGWFDGDMDLPERQNQSITLSNSDIDDIIRRNSGDNGSVVNSYTPTENIVVGERPDSLAEKQEATSVPGEPAEEPEKPEQTDTLSTEVTGADITNDTL